MVRDGAEFIIGPRFARTQRSDEAIQTAAAVALWIASRSLSSGGAFAPTRWLAMTSEQNAAFSRRNASELLERRPPSEKQRGRRECRMRVAPVAACAVKKHRRQQPQVHRINRHSLRDGFNGFLRALPGDRALLPPSLADRVR